MIGMPQLMGKGQHAVMRRIEVSEHAALPGNRKVCIIGSSSLPLMRLGIDPGAIEGMTGESSHIMAEGIIGRKHYFPCLIEAVASAAAHRGKEIEEGEVVHAEQPCLEREVFMKERQ